MIFLAQNLRYHLLKYLLLWQNRNLLSVRIPHASSNFLFTEVKTLDEYNEKTKYWRRVDVVAEVSRLNYATRVKEWFKKNPRYLTQVESYTKLTDEERKFQYFAHDFTKIVDLFLKDLGCERSWKDRTTGEVQSSFCIPARVKLNQNNRVTWEFLLILLIKIRFVIIVTIKVASLLIFLILLSLRFKTHYFKVVN